MRIISFEELKELQLDMLCKIDEFCRNNNINYTLAYGTLIGAIRHKGYIPWDDDIDVAMPRPDYNKFIATFNGVYEKYYVMAPDINANFYAPYANVCDNRTLLEEFDNSHRGIPMGIKIDVFPIDGTPDSEADYKNLVSTIKMYKYILTSKRNHYRFSCSISSIKSLIVRLISLFYKYEDVQKKIIKKCSEFPFNSSKWVDTVCFPVYKNTRVPKSFFDDYVDVDFEGKKFKSLKEYDFYLRAIYGDYLQLPPKDKQVPHHGFTAYWKD